MRPLLPILAGWILLTMIAPPAHAVAQQAEDDWRAPRWMGDVAFVGVNALMGGLTAGLSRTLRGGDLQDFQDGFARGALGGAVAFGGRKVAVQRFDGAGLLGRQVSAMGVSVARNAGEGRPSLERVVFPVGPLRLHLDRGEGGTTLHPKLVAYDIAAIIRTATRDDATFDWSASLSAGAPVFRGHQTRILSHGRPVRANTRAATILLADLPAHELRTTFPHERVHVLQHDFASLLWSDPLEAYLFEKSAVSRALYRYLDIGVTFPIFTVGSESLLGLKKENRLREIEARFLDGRIR